MKRQNLQAATGLLEKLDRLEKARDVLANFANIEEDLQEIAVHTMPGFVNVSIPIVSTEAQRQIGGLLFEIVRQQCLDVERELRALGLE